MPVGYSWPASGLIGYDMAKLHELKARTGKPVTQLLREAVELLYDSTSADDSPPITMAKPAEKRTNVIEPVQPIVEAYITTAKRRVQRTLFSDSSMDTVICAESDLPSE